MKQIDFYIQSDKLFYDVCVFLELAVLEDNKELRDTLSEFQMPTVQYGTLKIAGFGEILSADT